MATYPRFSILEGDTSDGREGKSKGKGRKWKVRRGKERIGDARCRGVRRGEEQEGTEGNSGEEGGGGSEEKKASIR